MNKYISLIKSLDFEAISDLVEREPKWIDWSEPSGKNALHFLCGLTPTNSESAQAAFNILKLLLKKGMDKNSIHRIEDKNCDHFPATPLWYAYTRGRNEKIYKYLLKNGADPKNCWWAIAWYDDVASAKLWLIHGAKMDVDPTLDELFLGSFYWNKLNFSQWIIEQGADVNSVGPDGITALMLAVKRKDENAIRFLVKAGADPDHGNAEGLTARKLVESKGPKRLLTLF